jgi:hypothetical protein
LRIANGMAAKLHKKLHKKLRNEMVQRGAAQLLAKGCR